MNKWNIKDPSDEIKMTSVKKHPKSVILIKNADITLQKSACN